MDDHRANLSANVRRLREERGLSQQRMATISGIPRPTWASLESGSANPTLSVLTRAATALQVSIEELIGAPRTAARLFRAGEIRSRVTLHEGHGLDAKDACQRVVVLRRRIVPVRPRFRKLRIQAFV